MSSDGNNAGDEPIRQPHHNNAFDLDNMT